jgi:hypothetical protein
MINFTKKELNLIEQALYHEIKTFQFFRGLNPIMKDRERILLELMTKIKQVLNEGEKNEE